jgi:hypothetical protein
VPQQLSGEDGTAGSSIHLSHAKRVCGSHRGLVEVEEAPGDIVQERPTSLDVTLGNGQQGETLVDMSEIVRVLKLLDQRSGLRKDASRVIVFLTHKVDVSEG